jgi:hypothetical protein
MTIQAVPSVALAADGTSLPGRRPAARHLRIAPVHDHTWILRDTEYDGGLVVRRYDCLCGDVTFG